MRWIALVAVLVAPAALAQTAGTVVLSGRITDAETGEALLGATVYATHGERGRGAATNAYGYYSLPLPQGRSVVAVRFVGYATRLDTLQLRADRTLDVALSPDAALGEVTVEADAAARPEATPQMGIQTMRGADIRALPALLGETDVLKAVQLLPGVRGGAEGTAGLYVRGGSPDQTLLLLDGTPVYNATHLFGFLSTFNGDAVNRVELTKGAFPARFGGRLASVLDVRLRDGDLERHRVQGQIGLLSTRLLAEGPIVPGKASFLISGRRSYVDVLARPFIAAANQESDEKVTPRAYFYDLNAKAHWTVSDRDRVYLSLYGGADVFGFDIVDTYASCFPNPDTGVEDCETPVEDRSGGGIDWGNLTGSLRYTRALSPRLFGALQATASDYDFNVGVRIEEQVGTPQATRAEARYVSGIRDLGLQGDLSWAAGRGHAVSFGASAATRSFTPGATSIFGVGDVLADTTLGADATGGLDLRAYAEDEWTPVPAFTLQAGLHGAVYTSEGRAFPSVEPRLSARLALAERVSAKASFAVTQQPLHLLTTGGGIGLPADLWVPATDRVAPQRGWQAALGLGGSLPDGRTSWSAEAYTRRMDGLVAYRPGAAFVTPFDDWQDLVVTGEGRSSGLELYAEHRTDGLSGWLGYTLAKTDHRFDAFDSGAWFPYRYDRRHDLSAVALYQLSRRVDVSAAFVFGTGDAVTLARATYRRPRYEFGDPEEWLRTAPDLYGYGSNEREANAYGQRNGFRLPAYHRLDVGATLYFRRGPRPHALALNIYNAYNRKNPFVTTLDNDVPYVPGAEVQQRARLRGVAIFPILPTLSYQFSF